MVEIYEDRDPKAIKQKKDYFDELKLLPNSIKKPRKNRSGYLNFARLVTQL